MHDCLQAFLVCFVLHAISKAGLMNDRKPRVNAAKVRVDYVA
jgi:hypothetical protein